LDLSHLYDVQDWDAVKRFGILGVINGLADLATSG
jgi:hypothetical protein